MESKKLKSKKIEEIENHIKKTLELIKEEKEYNKIFKEFKK